MVDPEMATCAHIHCSSLHDLLWIHCRVLHSLHTDGFTARFNSTALASQGLSCIFPP